MLIRGEAVVPQGHCRSILLIDNNHVTSRGMNRVYLHGARARKKNHQQTVIKNYPFETRMCLCIIL